MRHCHDRKGVWQLFGQWSSQGQLEGHPLVPAQSNRNSRARRTPRRTAPGLSSGACRTASMLQYQRERQGRADGRAAGAGRRSAPARAAAADWLATAPHRSSPPGHAMLAQLTLARVRDVQHGHVVTAATKHRRSVKRSEGELAAVDRDAVTQRFAQVASSNFADNGAHVHLAFGGGGGGSRGGSSGHASQCRETGSA